MLIGISDDKADTWECFWGCGKQHSIKHNRKKINMPTITEYKGNKLLCLNPDAKFTFSFGVQKAKMILEHYDAIKIFADSNGEICGQDEGEESQYLRGNKK